MYAVIFTSTLSADSAGYEDTAQRMLELCAEQPGFISADSVRGEDGRGTTVCMWESTEAIEAWARHPEHRRAQREGAVRWYLDYEVTVCEVLERPHRA